MRCGGVALAMWASLQKLEQRRSRARTTWGSMGGGGGGGGGGSNFRSGLMRLFVEGGI